MDFPAALTAAKAGKTISRPSQPGMSFAWIVGATTAAGPLAGVKPHLVMVAAPGKLIAYAVQDADMAADDWVAA